MIRNLAAVSSLMLVGLLLVGGCGPRPSLVGKWLVGAAESLWKFFWGLLGFLRDPQGKFSHKRLLALALGVVMIFLLLQKEFWGAGIAGTVTLILAAISAITFSQMGKLWLKLPCSRTAFWTSGSREKLSGCGPHPTLEI